MILVGFALVVLQGLAEAIRRVAFLRGRGPEPGAEPASTGEPHRGDIL